MTRAELWTIYTTKNPRMAGDDDATITLTVRGLRKLFETTWEQAHDAGFKNGEAWENNQAKMRKPKDDDPMKTFKDVFGKGGFGL